MAEIDDEGRSEAVIRAPRTRSRPAHVGIPAAFAWSRVVDHLAARSGQTVDVLGHSFGGVVAYGAAQFTDNVRSLVLYEGWPASNPSSMQAPADVRERMDQRLAAGDLEAALELFMREAVGMPDEEFAVHRTLPAWPREHQDTEGAHGRDSGRSGTWPKRRNARLGSRHSGHQIGGC